MNVFHWPSLHGPGSMPVHGGVFQGVGPWVITLCQPILNQCGRKWLNLTSIAPHNLWRSRPTSNHGYTVAEKNGHHSFVMNLPLLVGSNLHRWVSHSHSPTNHHRDNFLANMVNSVVRGRYQLHRQPPCWDFYLRKALVGVMT